MTGAAGSAVVFAYSEVGVRGLAALLAAGIDVRLVVTHEDDPQEQSWFASVAELARLHGIPVIAPPDANVESVVQQVQGADADFLFSLYYRQLLGAELLAGARRGAYNLHGSLLPRYRGRAPLNWAIINGETQTGVTLHRMTLRADAGAVVDRQAVAILPNDTALDVARKIACAAEALLLRSVPALLDGSATEQPQDAAAASYFGRRTPADGRIDWSQPARAVHDLIRAVAPPFPGAFTDIPAGRLLLLGSYYRGLPALGRGPRLYVQDDVFWVDCRDGERIRVLGLRLRDAALEASGFRALFGAELVLS
ncbi:MAG: formyltransferase [Pseudomonadales bacterium]